jgi:hypothetical protein
VRELDATLREPVDAFRAGRLAPHQRLQLGAGRGVGLLELGAQGVGVVEVEADAADLQRRGLRGQPQLDRGQIPQVGQVAEQHVEQPAHVDRVEAGVHDVRLRVDRHVRPPVGRRSAARALPCRGQGSE